MDTFNRISENGIVISEIFKVLADIKCSSGIWDFAKRILSLFPKIGMILLSKHLVTNLDNMGEYLLKTIRILLYRTESYNTSQGLGYQLYTLSPHYANTMISFERMVDTLYIRQLRFLPESAAYHELMQRANDRINGAKVQHATCSNAAVMSGTINIIPILPNKLFPSANFRKLADLINSSIRTSALLEQYRVTPILLNGEPGLGKSKSLDYIAYNTQICTIKKVDLTAFINEAKISITDIITMVMKMGSADGDHTLVIFDELDKYINGICKNDEDPAKINEMLLNSILSLIESNPKSRSCIFILFCSNNFGTIFDFVGAEDKIHYQSFEDRFLKLQFKRIDKAEFIEYIEWLAAKLQIVYDCDFSMISDNFTITFRKLDQFVRLNNYDIHAICAGIESYSVDTYVMQSKCRVIEKKSINIENKSINIEKKSTQARDKYILPSTNTYKTQESKDLQYLSNMFSVDFILSIDEDWWYHYEDCNLSLSDENRVILDTIINYIANNVNFAHNSNCSEDFCELQNIYIANCILLNRQLHLVDMINTQKISIQLFIKVIINYSCFGSVCTFHIYNKLCEELLNILKTQKNTLLFNLYITGKYKFSVNYILPDHFDGLSLKGEIPISQWLKMVIKWRYCKDKNQKIALWQDIQQYKYATIHDLRE